MILLFELYPIVFICTCAVLGLLIGSFLNVVIYRLPIMMQRDWQREFIAYFAPNVKPEPPGGIPLAETFNLSIPRSACPHCKTPIPASENIPLWSFLRKGGKCQHCDHPIALRYPMVELLTVMLSGFCAWHFGVTIECAIMLLVSWSLISAIAIDIDHMLLPDQITLPLLWLGLLSATQGWFVPLQDAVIGAAIGYLSLWSIYHIFKLLTGKEGMGYGDFKLLAAIGTFVGWQHLLVVILLSSVVGLIYALYTKIASAEPSSPDQTVPAGAIPFGPFLGVAGWITIIYGDAVVHAYLSYMGLR
jgi:leader peptidase (prepilin peptidase)/N-methyltransferase